MSSPIQTKHNHFIDGGPTEPAGGAFLQEFDPRTGEPSFTIARGNAADVDAAVRSAHEAWPQWRDRRPAERGRILTSIARLLRERQQDLVEIERSETGRPLWHARLEIETAAQYFEFYGGMVHACRGEVVDLGAGYHSYTRREPFGVVGIILPWNAPLNQAARGIAPALASGNAVVSKPSEFTSVSLIELARLAVEEAGLPRGLFNVVTGTGPEAGAAVAEHPLVRKIAFTGSVGTGRVLGRIAADRIIPIGLELGGKSPNIVFADADLEKAADGVVKSFTFNAGQVCSAGTRCLVERSIYDQFLGLLRERIAKVAVGADDQAAMGPIITKAQFERVQAFTRIAREEGAEVIEGGAVADPQAAERGWFIRPMLVTGLAADARTATEEIFGPIASVMPFDDEAEAVGIANASEYGLVAGLWTSDVSRAHRVAALLEAGQVFVNEYYAGGVETPFGGYKQSGHGREKGVEALLHYTQVKCVTIKL
ncbi:MAG: aldehyde dehydrogenase family protein [Rhizobiaceae bacterium]|nr:aldehyde dehydrogenase family protein [Rhizobiaceae bacterium]